MGAVSIERLTMIWEMRLVLPVVDLDHHWQLALRWGRGFICATMMITTQELALKKTRVVMIEVFHTRCPVMAVTFLPLNLSAL